MLSAPPDTAGRQPRRRLERRQARPSTPRIPRHRSRCPARSTGTFGPRYGTLASCLPASRALSRRRRCLAQVRSRRRILRAQLGQRVARGLLLVDRDQRIGQAQQGVRGVGALPAIDCMCRRRRSPPGNTGAGRSAPAPAGTARHRRAATSGSCSAPRAPTASAVGSRGGQRGVALLHRQFRRAADRGRGWRGHAAAVAPAARLAPTAVPPVSPTAAALAPRAAAAAAGRLGRGGRVARRRPPCGFCTWKARSSMRLPDRHPAAAPGSPSHRPGRAAGAPAPPARPPATAAARRGRCRRSSAAGTRHGPVGRPPPRPLVLQCLHLCAQFQDLVLQRDRLPGSPPAPTPAGATTPGQQGRQVPAIRRFADRMLIWSRLASLPCAGISGRRLMMTNTGGDVATPPNETGGRAGRRFGRTRSATALSGPT